MIELDHFATLAPSSAATPTRRGDDGKSSFEQAIEALQAQAANLGAYKALDAVVRQACACHIAATANDQPTQASIGDLTWARAAEQANVPRTAMMKDRRGRSSLVDNALAECLWPDGETFNALVAEKALKRFGRHADFHALPVAQQDRVYAVHAAIVQSSAVSRPAATVRMPQVCHTVRALLVATVAISACHIATAKDQGHAAPREGSVVGARIAGGMAAGALAGLACRTGAPVCVTLAAIVSGTLAGLGAGALR